MQLSAKARGVTAASARVVKSVVDFIVWEWWVCCLMEGLFEVQVVMMSVIDASSTVYIDVRAIIALSLQIEDPKGYRLIFDRVCCKSVPYSMKGEWVEQYYSSSNPTENQDHNLFVCQQ